jgi:hypothetical protein
VGRGGNLEPLSSREESEEEAAGPLVAAAGLTWLARIIPDSHRLNMELDLQSLFGLHVHSCTHWLRPPQLPPSHAFGLIYEGAIGKAKIDEISL